MSHRMTLSCYAQNWDGERLALRLLIAPRGNPLTPLAPGEPAFADFKPHLDIRVIAGLDTLPTLGAAAASHLVDLPLAARAREICAALDQVLPIDPTAAPVDARVAGVRFMKFAPTPYRELTGYGGDGNPYLVTDDRYRCALERPIPEGTSLVVENKKLPWGKVLGLALRQPLLAEAVGIVRSLDIEPTFSLLDAGGWVFATLAPGAPGSSLLSVPDAVNIYAARIPPLSTPRRLFTAVLFPVKVAVPSATYDEVFREAVDYDDGFAKVVYAAQPQHLNPLSEEADGSRPVREIGIQLGWDDEQVVTWLNRQIQPAAAAQDAPMGVMGYRIDAREAGKTAWSSLVMGRSALVLDGVDLGVHEGEFRVEIAPNKLMGDSSGDYWCPIYFTDWNGPSLVGPDALGLRLQELNPEGPVQGLDPDIRLRYGRNYEFRVRLVDHTGGGPGGEDNPANPAPHPVGSHGFRRHVRPGPIRFENRPPPEADPENPPETLRLKRPRLGYPACLFAGGDSDDLLADLASAKAEGRQVGLPDPDVAFAEIQVLVQRSDTETGWLPLYTAVRPFPTDSGEELVVDLEWRDIADATALSAPAAGPLPLPTSRSLRLDIRALAAERDDYYGADDVRRGELSSVSLTNPAEDETGLFLPQTASDAVRAHFMQPDVAVDSMVKMAQMAAGKFLAAPQDALGLLTESLGLSRIEYGLRALAGRRLVFGCSSRIRHVLGPDGGSLRFASSGDITLQWVVALRATLNRDWSWQGLRHLSVMRDGVEVGRLEVPRSLSEEAAGGDSTRTDLLFLDAIDPKPQAGQFPQELNPVYRLVPVFRTEPAHRDPAEDLTIRLPITTPPAQQSRLLSAGLALSPYVRDEGYSSTEARERVLWLEFDGPPENPNDGYFARVLAYAPDPVLARTMDLKDQQPEPPLAIDPEPLRVVVPGQSDDRNGEFAMQPLLSTESDRHYIVPLPAGMTSESLELFGFFTYEVRLGHVQGWSTAQARFGRPLRVTGVQHPSPVLRCGVVRSPAGIEVSTSPAQPVEDGRVMAVFPPATEIWVLLYCQVRQADDADSRNVLLSCKRGEWNFSKWDRERRHPPISAALATWSSDEIARELGLLGLGKSAPLSCLAVETLPADQPISDPLKAGLGYERFLRTSPLTRIPPMC